MPKIKQKAAITDRRIKLTPEVVNALLVAIMQSGSIASAVRQLPIKISYAWISEKRSAEPEFDRRVQLALKAYRAGNPQEDVEKVNLLDQSLLDYLKVGELETLTEHDPKTNEITRLQRRIKKRFDPAVWNILHPKKVWSEQAVLLVTANQLQDLSSTEDLTEAERSKFIKWLSTWITKATSELQKQGLTVKQLAESNE